MSYPNELDVAVVEVKVRNPYPVHVKLAHRFSAHQLNTAFLSCPIFMISLPVYDIYHTQVDYRARKALCVILYRVELY